MAAQPTPPKPMPTIGGDGSDLPRLFDSGDGEAFSSSFICTTALKRLPSNPCRFVFLSNWNVDASVLQTFSALSAANLYENAGLEIYYGFRGVIAHQLYASQNSPFLPVSNTNQISVRVRTGAADRTIWFSWFY